MQFQVGKRYENRRGTYTVLQLQKGQMLIRYDDGTEQIIRNLAMQARIVQAVNDEKNRVYDDCLCTKSDKQILGWIQTQTLPDESLVNNCCWRRICQVRGRNLSQVDDIMWEEICTRRGYLHARQNPRGF